MNTTYVLTKVVTLYNLDTQLGNSLSTDLKRWILTNGQGEGDFKFMWTTWFFSNVTTLYNILF